MNTNPPPIEHFRLLEEYDRLLGLKAAISRVVRPGDIVLDAGCGTGVLGLLAFQAGAEKVIAVDSHDLNFAKDLARENHLVEAVQYIQDDLDNLEPDALPSFDIVLAMIYSGHPILDEGQVSTKHVLCKKFLLPGGRLIPNRIKWHAYACEWPRYDLRQQTYRFDRSISDLSSHLGLCFPSYWATRLSHTHAWKRVTAPYHFGGGGG